jgi:hypothetical protein
MFREELMMIFLFKNRESKCCLSTLHAGRVIYIYFFVSQLWRIPFFHYYNSLQARLLIAIQD